MTDANVLSQPVAPPAAPAASLTLFDLKVGFGISETYRMLTFALDQGCSDIKVQSGDYVTVYWRRQWHVFSTRILEDTEANKILTQLAGPSAITLIGGGGEVDQDPEFFREDGYRVMVRLRMNAVGSRVGGYKDGVAITLRTIPPKLPELAMQGLPEGLADDLLPERGTLLISGPTGSGKTTLIAACLHERSKESPAPCIITYENPPEFTYDKAGIGRGPLVAQASIGSHLKSWSRAGPTAMRRKADIILMGEVRDLETAEATMEMGITGHCVYATLHADTLRRIGEYIDGINKRFAKNVLIDVKVYNVSMNKEANTGFSANVIYNQLNRYGFSMLGTSILQPPSGAQPATMTFNASDPNSRFNGSSLLVQAMQGVGDVSLVTSGTVIAINGQPAPMQVANEITYLASSTTTQTPNVGTTTTLTPATRVVGFTANFLPLILGDNRILLQYQMSISSLQMSQVSSGNSLIQTPNVATQSLQQQAFLKDGQSIVLFGFEQNRSAADSNASVGGASQSGKQDRSMTVIVMQVHGGSRDDI